LSKRPNILFLFSDQHRKDAMSCAGHPIVKTPSMDLLAEDGVMFSNAYCPTPLCIPSRTAIFTGRFGHNTGILVNKGRLPEGEPTFVKQLNEAGYRTCMIGKTHLGQHAPGGSAECDKWLSDMGFTDTLSQAGKWSDARLTIAENPYQQYLEKKGLMDILRDDYNKRMEKHHPTEGGNECWEDSPSVLPEEDFGDFFIGNQAANWIKEYSDDKPFFCWCNWGGPHEPFDPPLRYLKMYSECTPDTPIDDFMENAPTPLIERKIKDTGSAPANAWQAVKARYYSLINVIDDSIKDILCALKEKNLLENTIIIYASDHGEMLYDHGLIRKSCMYEASVGVPLIIRWPSNFIKNVKVNHPVSLLDLTPTILELAGAQPLPVMHGKSLIPLLEGQTPYEHGDVFSEMDCMKMLRRDNWKYVYHPSWDTPQLFDLSDDPEEKQNLSGLAHCSALENSLKDSILNWMINTSQRPNSNE